MSNIRFSIHTYYPYFVQNNYASSFGHMFTGVSLIPHVTEQCVVGNHGCKNGVFKRHGGVITGVIYDHDTLTRKVADCVPENCYHPDQQPIISMEIQHTPYHLDLYLYMWCIGLELHHAQFHNYSTSSTHAYGAISCEWILCPMWLWIQHHTTTQQCPLILFPNMAGISQAWGGWPDPLSYQIWTGPSQSLPNTWKQHQFLHWFHFTHVISPPLPPTHITPPILKNTKNTNQYYMESCGRGNMGQSFSVSAPYSIYPIL